MSRRTVEISTVAETATVDVATHANNQKSAKCQKVVFHCRVLVTLPNSHRRVRRDVPRMVQNRKRLPVNLITGPGFAERIRTVPLLTCVQLWFRPIQVRIFGIFRIFRTT